ncbi:cyclopropane-fatty-acyl-phospholipid synthase family protein [Terrarubrum flagellatum]|uniref:cyclopropane-fatty-acyl-phospholipid synthase family protein n=1 Tax=Terrirubrum flagellatum TaxID=2895980 RepID=UPI003144F0D8
MDWLLEKVFTSIVRSGRLMVTTAGGRTIEFGDGSGPPHAIRFTGSAAQLKVLLDPELQLGEAFMDGSLIVEQGALIDVLRLLSDNYYSLGEPPWWARALSALRYGWRRISQLNVRSASQRNVAHHYDLDGGLYSLFLDADRQYSCAYFERPDQSLDEAQLAKKRHLAAKLLVKPGQRVLDIGSGWGGLALYLAEICNAQPRGVTLSKEQLATASERARQKNLTDRVRFDLIDYRDIQSVYDRIVSVGMFEHVGVGFYDAYFRKCAEMLKEDGVMVLHSIGRNEPPGATNPWIAKYIFPGGYIPSLSEVLPAIERAGLMVTDVEILRLHYAETLKAWRERFMARRDEAARLYDERFCRMWEFYLASSEAAFRSPRNGLMVFQVQLAKKHGVVPVTRDYIAAEENRLRSIEQLKGASTARRPRLQIAGE